MKKRKLSNALLSSIIALTSVSGSLPIALQPVYAAELTGTAIESEEQLESFLAGSDSSGYLTKGITVTKILTVKGSKELNLNTYNVSVELAGSAQYAFKVPSGTSLVLTNGTASVQEYLLALVNAGGTLNLSEVNVTKDGNKFSVVQSAGTTTIENSNLDSNGTIFSVTGGVFNVSGGELESSASSTPGISITGGAATFTNIQYTMNVASGQNFSNGASLTINGENTLIQAKGDTAYGITAWANSNTFFNNGTLESTGIGFTTNGTNDPNDKSYGANANFTMTGGKISAATALYLPSVGGETKINGGEITGSSTGIEIRAGNLTINPTKAQITINGNGNPYGAGFNGSGTTTVGAAIVASQHTTYKPITVTIQKGDFPLSINAPEGYALVANDTNVDNPKYADSQDDITFTISGGNFTGGLGPIYIADYLDSDIEHFVSGGQFNKSIQPSLVYNPTFQSYNGTWFSYWGNKNDAMSAAGTSGTIFTPDIDADAWIDLGMIALNFSGDGFNTFELSAIPGDVVQLPQAPKRTNYIFSGWKDSNGKVWQAGENYTVSAAMNFSAIWTYSPPVSSTPDNNGPSIGDSDNSGNESGINNGISGSGEGFTEPGSTTKPAEDGSSVTFTQDEDGTKTATTQDSKGEITSAEVTVPSTAITDGKVSIDLGTNTETKEKLTIVGNKTDEEAAPSLNIKLPANTKADVEVTVQDGTMKPGTVAMIETEDGKLIPIPTTTSDGNVLNIPLEGSQKIVIMDNSKTFSDTAGVPSYATNAAAYVSARELMTGMGTAEPKPFSFDSNLSRGQFATILYRLVGEPKGTGEYPEGIIPGAWNADAARWAVQQGLMAQGGAAFNPQGDISREQIIAIMWRLQKSPVVSTDVLDDYADADQIQSDDFKQAMAWAVSIGVVGQGTENLDPDSDASRAEIAAMLQRFIQVLY